MRYVVALTLLLAACTPAGETLTSSPIPTASTAAATAPATPTSDPALREFRTDASAPFPPIEIWATSWSNLVRRWSNGTTSEIPYACREATSITPDPRGGVLVYCDAPDGSVGTTSRIFNGTVTTVLAGSAGSAMSPDGRSLVVTRRGTCPGPAPVCDWRVVLVDLATRSEREVLPNGYYLGAQIGWTPLGLTYFQPECAEAGCSGSGDKGGTFVWDGARFARRTALRFVASAGSYEVYERMKSFSQLEPRGVVLGGPSGERDIISGVGVRALSVNATGETLVWHGGQAQRGWFERYDAKGQLVWKAEAEGQTVQAASANVIVTAKYSMMGLPTFHVYDIDGMTHFEVALGDARVWTVARRSGP